MKKLPKIVLCGLALAIPLRALSYSPLLQRSLVGAGDYVRIDDDVYAAPEMPAPERARALAMLQAARRRIADVYGEPVARPLTILARDAQAAARFGLGDVPGTTFISALGAQVVLNMDQSSVDVTAHELTHAEIAARLGYWTRLRKLPVWFDEGVAVQLDWRPQYMLDCAILGRPALRRVTALDTARKFRDGDRARIVGNYRAAKCAAAHVLAQHPPRTLYAGLARLREGDSFDAVFGPVGIE